MTDTPRQITKIAFCALLTLVALHGASATTAGETNLVHTVPDDGVLFLSATRDGRVIWDLSRVSDREATNLEFPDLIRFKDRWYCSFREGNTHGNDPSGRARVITSQDGETWETATLIEWEGGDVRDPRMSITADGQLMINAAIYFIGEQKADPAEWEVPGKRQSVTWLSEDGRTWTGPYACPTGFDTWRWDVAWHDGYGYSAGYAGKDRKGTLYRTKDGKTWEVWVENFFGGPGTEAALAFGADGTGYCLLRGGDFYGKFAVGRGPDFKEWTWHDMRIDAARNGETESGTDFGKRTSSIVGGQKLLLLSDGRLVVTTAKGGCDLFLVDPERALFTRIVRMSDGMSYPGLVEHDGEFWMTNSQRAKGYDGVKSGIYLYRVKIPPPESMDHLLRVAANVLSVEADGFGRLYREQLASARGAGQANGDGARGQLLKALADYREARERKQTGLELLASETASLKTSGTGFGQRARDRLSAQLDPLRVVLADASATLVDVDGRIAEVDTAAADVAAARRIKADADRALSRARTMALEAAEGFARLYRDRIAQDADRLDQWLADPAATSETVRQQLESLLAAADEYCAIGRHVPVAAAAVTHTPCEVVLEDEAAWRTGALVNLTVDGDALVLVSAPVLSFGEQGTTCVRIGNPPEVASLKNNFTVGAWGFPRTDESYRTLLDKGGRDAAISIRMGRSEKEKSPVSVRAYAEGEPAPNDPYQVGHTPADPAAFENCWHYYAVTYDGQALKLYLDGAMVGAFPKKGNMDLSEGDLFFGCSDSGREPWKGYIADVAIWSTALSPDQIVALGRRSPRGDEEGLIGYWPLNEGQGEVVRDLTAHGNDGRISGGNWLTLPVRHGYRLSNPVCFDAVRDITSCSIEWEAVIEGDSAKAEVSVLYGVSDNADILPEEWQPATNGEAIAVGPGGVIPTGKTLWLKQVLTTEDSATIPRLRRLALKIR